MVTVDVVSPASRLKKRFHFRTVTGGGDEGQRGGHVEEEDSNQNTGKTTY